ncbi:hypothetical protein [Edaphobacter bradus]|uniref:hypothetical protein n=1 Tax=Edaphobacter bradus TaxID=2259016 RepID=UPI0021E09091|nr:hypothetical protein [Edaphobacter bradus]
MKLVKAALLLLFLALPWALHAQMMLRFDDIKRFEVGGNFDYLHANAPPGHCGCFSMYGGSGTFLMNVTRKWSALADITVAHASNVNNSGQNILIINYLFGPRFTYRNPSRYVPYGEVLLGGAKEDVNFQFTINRQSFGVLAGGGVRTRIKPRLGANIIQVDYVYTRIPNAVNNTQNNLRISTGITYHFGGGE